MLVSPERRELTYLHGMRAICALFVAFAHALMMFQYAIQDQGSAFWQELLFISQYSRYAVSIFIVLSGYCLIYSLVNIEAEITAVFWKRFIIKRIRRIVPAYYAAMALALLLIFFVPALKDSNIGLWNRSIPAWTFGSVVSHLFLLHNYFPQWQYSINHPMWSVATEFQIYFLFPILVYFWKKYGAGKLLIVSLLVSIILLIILIVAGTTHDPWPPQFVALFGFGMLAGSLANNVDDSKTRPTNRKMKTSRNFALMLFLLAVVAVPIGRELKQIVPDILFGGSAALMMKYLTECKFHCKKSIILNFLETRILVNAGIFSYSIYLVHAPLLALSYVVGVNVGLRGSGLIVFSMTIGMGFVICVSYIFYILFEKTFLNKTIRVQSS